MPAKKMRSIAPNRRKAYEGIKRSLRRSGLRGQALKTRAAKIANAGRTRAGRKRMARKGGRKRKRR